MLELSVVGQAAAAAAAAFPGIQASSRNVSQVRAMIRGGQPSSAQLTPNHLNKWFYARRPSESRGRSSQSSALRHSLLTFHATFGPASRAASCPLVKATGQQTLSAQLCTGGGGRRLLLRQPPSVCLVGSSGWSVLWPARPQPGSHVVNAKQGSRSD